ncbi:MAG: sugar ABC transporter permease [Chloroflexi bacterium]|nr:sugar ABC transporter permease [Chloroflexota bacterium]MDA8219291.1 sugar ABC transporter permease [Dehalococcoidales bacterium]
MSLDQRAAVSPDLTRKRPSILGYLERESVLGWVLVAPTLVVLLGLVAYPFLMALWMSLTNRVIAQPGEFIGLRNFEELLRSQIFRQTVTNSFVYTFAGLPIKLVGGIGVALALNRQFQGLRIVRAALLLPWIVPAVLITLAWLWMFDASLGVFNWVLLRLGIVRQGIPWLADPALAMASLVLVNSWRAIPFWAITILAGLQTIPQELYEAAVIDGAGPVGKFRYVTLPLIMPVLGVVLLLSIIWTFADFQTVYALTGGGPANSTHLFATLSFQTALVIGKLGQGAAISLFLFPVFVIVVILQLRSLRKD